VELPDRVEQRPLPEVELIRHEAEFQGTGEEQVISRKLAEKFASGSSAKAGDDPAERAATRRGILPGLADIAWNAVTARLL